ncbi:MAG TPA: isoprenylcysteine carboxylmethyltransferase family protein, partial [Candidatus Dormibacteraeota bacterium]|nr:isoprenylcysteine carboxylmethyltransferase family protein [Candidatus Dormibacteraeota bacterium]
SVLRLLLTVTWAAWIWLELVAVFLPTVLDRLRGRGRPRDAGSVAVLLLCIAAGFVAATRLARLDFGALPGPPAVLLGGGLVVMWAGLALRAWSIQHLGGLFRAVVVIQPDHRLVTDGPYRHLRHPSYSGALLAALGFGIALGHWTSLLALLAGWAVGIAYRIRVEEAAMGEAFGAAYTEYAARTRRLIPLVY